MTRKLLWTAEICNVHDKLTGYGKWMHHVYMLL